MNSFSPRQLLSITALVLLCGCGGGGSDVLDPVIKAPSGLAVETRASMEAAAAQFADDVRAGRADAVAERFDLDAFVRGVCQGTGCKKKVRQDFADGLVTGLSERPGGLMAHYLSEDFRFLRLVEEEDATHMLFRAWDEEAGVDYLRCSFDKADGEWWRIVDVYSYTSGEPFTDSVRRTYLPVLVGGEKADELRGKYEPLGEVVDLLDQGDRSAARGALVVLPESVREQRFARVLELDILSGIDDAADDYATAAERFEQDFPNDPSLPLRMLEAHSIRGEHEAALRRVDRIEEMVGGDPFLQFLRAGALAGLGRHLEAVSGLEAAITAEPEIEGLRWALVNAALPARDFEAVAATLRALRGDFEYQLGTGEIEEAEQYRDFVASPEGKALLDELR